MTSREELTKLFSKIKVIEREEYGWFRIKQNEIAYSFHLTKSIIRIFTHVKDGLRPSVDVIHYDQISKVKYIGSIKMLKFFGNNGRCFKYIYLERN